MSCSLYVLPDLFPMRRLNHPFVEEVKRRQSKHTKETKGRDIGQLGRDKFGGNNERGKYLVPAGLESVISAENYLLARPTDVFTTPIEMN